MNAASSTLSVQSNFHTWHRILSNAPSKSPFFLQHIEAVGVVIAAFKILNVTVTAKCCLFLQSGWGKNQMRIFTLNSLVVNGIVLHAFLLILSIFKRKIIYLNCI